MNAYVTLEEAQEYFDERLNVDPWEYSDDESRAKALKMGTRAIDKLNFIGEKTDESQELQFPRGGSTEVPTAIKDACCELALVFLDDVDTGMEINDIRIMQHHFADVKNTYNGDYAPDYVMAGIPSAVAWQLLLPYLRDSRSALIRRAN